MAKRRITKASKRRLAVFGTLSITVIFIFAFSLLYNIYTIFNLTNEKIKLESFYVNLQEEAEQLKIDIEKLNDPKYLAAYARKEYGYSGPGEYILKLGDDINQTNDTISALNIEIKKDYIIIGLSVLMFFIFVYILFKGKRKPKNKRR